MMPNTPTTPNAHGAATRSVTSWASIWAGAAIALGIAALFSTAGLATSAAAVDFGADDWWKVPLESLAGGSGIALLAALFVGGFIAAWGSGARMRLDGALHGAATWSVVAIFATWLVGSAAAAMVGGVVKGAGSGARALGGAIGSGAGALGDVGRMVKDKGKQAMDSHHASLDMDGLLRPVNKKLQESGRKPLERQQVENAAHKLFERAVSQGSMDKATVLNTVVQQTSIAREDAQMVANELQAQFDAVRERAEQTMDEVREKAAELRSDLKEQAMQHGTQIASAISKAFWGLFTALALSLATALAGGLAGSVARARMTEA